MTAYVYRLARVTVPPRLHIYFSVTRSACFDCDMLSYSYALSLIDNHSPAISPPTMRESPSHTTHVSTPIIIITTQTTISNYILLPVNKRRNRPYFFFF